MKIIAMQRHLSNVEKIRRDFQAQTPFHYVVIDDFLEFEEAERLLHEFPAVDRDSWIDVKMAHQRKKWARPAVDGSAAGGFFVEANSPELRSLLGGITGLEGLLADPELEGAGYHQILDGGFLNIHVDFNRLSNGLDRRLNLLVYLNRGWKPEFGGNLELWDRAGAERIANIEPAFNRCVLFETNEVSYHGHPVPVRTRGTTTRKSLSIYYYTKGREDISYVPNHTTIYFNTQGAIGRLRILRAGFEQRVRKYRLKLQRLIR